jgi:hypothetical protein
MIIHYIKNLQLKKAKVIRFLFKIKLSFIQFYSNAANPHTIVKCFECISSNFQLLNVLLKFISAIIFNDILLMKILV